MVKRNAVLILIAVIVVLLVLFYPTRERQVKKRFKVLREWAHVEGPEEAAVQLGKYRRILDLVADPLEFESKGHNFSRTIPREEVATQAAGWRARFKSLDVEFADLTVTFPEDDQAQAIATVHVTGAAEGGDTLNETHELQASLRKEERGWVFTRFELVQVLER